MGVRIDIFIDKEIRRQAKYTGLILFIVNFVCIFPMIIWGIVNKNLGVVIYLLSLLVFVGLMTMFLTIAMRKKASRKVIFAESEIKIVSNKSKLLYKIENIKIKRIKKVSLVIENKTGRYGSYTRLMDAIVICCTEEDVEQEPRWSDYSKKREFLFIENRPGLELLLNQYLPHLKIEGKD